MEALYIVIILVWSTSVLVKSDVPLKGNETLLSEHSDRPLRQDVTSTPPDCTVCTKKCEHCFPLWGINLMIVTIVLLITAVLCLIVYLYFLKRKLNKTTYSGTARNDTGAYIRQESVEREILVTPRFNHNHKKYFPTRQDSNMEIVEYPTTVRNLKRDEINDYQMNPSILKGFQNVPFKDELKAVLSKTKHAMESTSMSDLNKILKEDQQQKEITSMDAAINKSSSSPIIDVCDTLVQLQLLPSTLNIKGLSEYKEKESPNSSPSKDKVDNREAKEDESSQEDNSNNIIDDLNDIYDNPLISSRSALVSLVDGKESPNIIKPQLTSSNPCLVVTSDTQEDDVYDNPSCIVRPVARSMNHVDDIYGTNPNRSLTNSESDQNNVDNIYDNPRNGTVVLGPMPKKSNSLPRLSTCKTNNIEDEIYEIPPKKERVIRFSKADDTEYLIAITNSTENCVEPCYINAKKFKTSEEK